MQSRLHRAQRAAKSRRNLVQCRPRKETEFHDQAMLFRQARHRSANPSGHLRTPPRSDRASAQCIATWPRASDAESLTAFWCRRPFKNRCRRMPYSQVENRQRPSKRAKDRHASTSVSCTRSSAQWLSFPRASAQRHRGAACCPASRSKAIASPALARSINSCSSSSCAFTVPVIPLLPTKGSRVRTFSCKLLLPPHCLRGAGAPQDRTMPFHKP